MSETTPTGSTAIMTRRQITLVIVGLMCGMFLSSLDQTVVGTAIRTIGDDLQGLDQQAWVTTAYLIVSTIATPIYGKLSDIFGRRPLYIFAIGMFILGSVLSAFSTSMIMLAAMRAVQAIGAGGLMSLPLAIMGDILAPRERAKYQGYFLAVFGISSIVGPLIGGLFAGADQILWITGWRWVFLINVPVGIAALVMVIAFLHLPRFHGHSTRIDWWGATAVIVALVPALLVAEEGNTWGWDSAAAITCYIVSAIGIVGFILIERAMGESAIIPLALFRSGPFSMSIVLGILMGFGMFGAMMTLPLYLQIVVGMNPTESGFATLPMLLGLMIASIVSGQIISRTGKYRWFTTIGAAFTAGGFLWFTFLTADSGYWTMIAPAMFVLGAGMGQLMQPLVLAGQNAVEPKDMGVATSSSTFFRQIGGTVGVAVLLSVLFTVLPGSIKSSMADRGELRAALDAALDPAVATAPANAGIMAQMWSPITDELQAGVAEQMADATQQVLAQLPPGTPQAVVDEVLQQAADKAGVSVIDGALAVDWSDPAQRAALLDGNGDSPGIVETIADEIADGGSGGAGTDISASTSDTSYLTGADPRLTRPFLVGFTSSAVSIFWIAFAVIALMFLLTFFFKVPELRQRSAAQERANAAAQAERIGLEAAEGLAAATIEPEGLAEAVISDNEAPSRAAPERA